MSDTPWSAQRRVLEFLRRRAEENEPETAVELTLTELRRVQPNASRLHVVQMLKELSEQGHGIFVPGRKGRPSRFRYVSTMRRKAEPAAAVKGPDGASSEGTAARGTAAPPPPAEHIARHGFRLRRDFLASLDLPDDLTLAEAERLAAFVRTLPLEI